MKDWEQQQKLMYTIFAIIFLLCYNTEKIVGEKL